MINQYDLNKAFMDKIRTVTNKTIVLDGKNYQPDPSDAYVEEKTVPTSVTQPLGLGADTQRGFYQITVCTPIANGKLFNLSIVDPIIAEFPKGLASGVTYNDQKVFIQTVTPSGLYSDDTHLKTAITINYTVIA